MKPLTAQKVMIDSELVPVSDWRSSLASPKTPIRKALEIVDASACQIVLVADEKGCLVGTMTDGDARRGILRGVSLEESVECVMQTMPVSATCQSSPEERLSKVDPKHIRQLPILDLEGRIVGLEAFRASRESSIKENWVVLMAGGVGRRLMPLTEECPKPLLKVGTKPILETILENFAAYGFRKFFFAVCYKDEMLKEYFSDGSKWGVDIQYLREDSGLGTAGALSLLKRRPKAPLILMNGDLLTKVNFSQLLDFHYEQKADVTLCIREYDFQVPYGVVKLHDQRILKLDEKPIQRFFVNAGIYVLEPSVLKHIPADETFDMPQLLDKLFGLRLHVAAFPIREYWLDIGRMDDLEKANVDFFRIFK
ncbi:MAG: nucleotidyltransferase family protein [Candidatus Omnitrophota bacterium]